MTSYLRPLFPLKKIGDLYSNTMGHFWSNPTTAFQEDSPKEMKPLIPSQQEVGETEWLEVSWLEKQIIWMIVLPGVPLYLMKPEEGCLEFWLRSFHWLLADIGHSKLDHYTGLKVYHSIPLSLAQQCYLKGVMAAAAVLVWKHTPLLEIVFEQTALDVETDAE